jgi:hypothetical protein
MYASHHKQGVHPCSSTPAAHHSRPAPAYSWREMRYPVAMGSHVHAVEPMCPAL